MLLSCLVAVGLLSFAGIHWTDEKDHRPYEKSTTKSAILLLLNNVTNRRNTRNTFQSPSIVSPVHADAMALRISNSNRSHVPELVSTPDLALGTTNLHENVRPKKFIPVHVVPPPLNTTTIMQAAETTIQSVFIGNIFMDFYESDERFVYAHYKSIESILHVYPLADVLTLIVGPRQLDYYKLGDNLSKHQFQKYRKRGYKVRLD